MLILALKPGHDGAIAALQDDELLFSLEAEKDTWPRHLELTPLTFLDALERLGEVPDIVAVGGWPRTAPPRKGGSPAALRGRSIGAGYEGFGLLDRPTRFLGKPVRLFSSSHERSHVAMALGMAPLTRTEPCVVLVWEGRLGDFYIVDQDWAVTERIPVMRSPGARYAWLYALGDPGFPTSGRIPRREDAGKLMALAAYGDATAATPDVYAAVERLLTLPYMYRQQKEEFRDAPFYNAGLQSEIFTTAAALLSDRIFEIFAGVARERLPGGVPLLISGGCGLNCDWNFRWRELGHFSSVFVPPCADDSGSALGTAIDARGALTGSPSPIRWSVYSGLEFDRDVEPDSAVWGSRPLDNAALSGALCDGRIVAWVQGRWEIGPRALGHRSILAEPFHPETRDRLNEIKDRESFRPIAPCCRLEDAAAAFVHDFPDPYMLYFRLVRDRRLRAVTHVDNSARVQTVDRDTNTRLHGLLSAFADRAGIGVLCNTSLNFKGQGFINRMSDLLIYCEDTGIADMVVGDVWFTRSPR